MGLWDDFTDFVEDAADYVADGLVEIAGDVADITVDVAEGVGGAVLDAAGVVVTAAAPVLELGLTIGEPLVDAGRAIVDGYMDFIEDPVGALKDAGQAIEDGYNAIVDDPVGLLVDGFEAVGDYGADIIRGVGDVFVGFGEAAWETGGLALEAVGSTGGVIGGALGAAGDLVDDATFGLAGATLDLIDDGLFDTVDWATGGLVDIDFDEGQFSVDLGMDNVLGGGISIGEQGASANIDIPFIEIGAGLTGQHGAAVTWDVVLPGDDLGPAVGAGISADGGVGLFMTDGEITETVIGSYDDHGTPDLTLRTAPPGDGPGPDAPAPMPNLDGPEASPAVIAAANLNEALPAQAPDAATELVQDLAGADSMADAAAELWDDLA